MNTSTFRARLTGFGLFGVVAVLVLCLAAPQARAPSAGRAAGWTTSTPRRTGPGGRTPAAGSEAAHVLLVRRRVT
jgi:hypothetical protein